MCSTGFFCKKEEMGRGVGFLRGDRDLGKGYCRWQKPGEEEGKQWTVASKCSLSSPNMLDIITFWGWERKKRRL